MTDHLPDVELTTAQEERAKIICNMICAHVYRNSERAARLIVHLQDRVAELEGHWLAIFGERDFDNAAQWVADLLWNQRPPSMTPAEQPLTWETFWQAVRESNWAPSPDDLRKILNKQIEQGAGPEIPPCTAVTTDGTPK